MNLPDFLLGKRAPLPPVLCKPQSLSPWPPLSPDPTVPQPPLPQPLEPEGREPFGE